MAKQGKPKTAPKAPPKKTRLYQGMLAVAVVAIITFVFLSAGRDSSSGSDVGAPEFSSSAMRNRLVLPAFPQKPRPITLSPESFAEPEIRAAYQAAKDVPEVLENVPCYCGCYGSAGHRNNLDCYKDNHGVT